MQKGELTQISGVKKKKRKGKDYPMQGVSSSSDQVQLYLGTMTCVVFAGLERGSLRIEQRN